MKHICQHILPVLGLLLTIFVACSDDRLTDVTENDNPGSIREVYVNLTVATDDAGRSRAVRSPQPGENGDGPEEGSGDENVITDLNVFFFDAGTDNNGSRPSINAAADVAANTPVITFYTDELLTVTVNGQRGYTTGSRNLTDMGIDLEMGKTYDVLILANYGADYGAEYEAANGTSLTLNALRDAVIEAEPSTEGANGSPVFKSSTGRIICTDETGNSRFLMASAGADVPAFTVKPNTNITPATATVTLERMAARVDYHVLPEYTVKVTENPTAQTPTVREDKAATDFLRYYTTYSPPDETDWMQLILAAANEDVNNPVYHRLGYTRENVAQVIDGNRPETALCVVFKAKYTPAEIDGAANNELKTFYWFHNKAYSSLEELQKANNDILGSATIDETNLTDYGIRRYDGGICYYTYYIRHADDGDINTDSPMEYATVRNNIYRLNVLSVSGPGGSGDIIVTVTPAPWRNDINVYPEF